MESREENRYPGDDLKDLYKGNPKLQAMDYDAQRRVMASGVALWSILQATGDESNARNQIFLDVVYSRVARREKIPIEVAREIVSRLTLFLIGQKWSFYLQRTPDVVPQNYLFFTTSPVEITHATVEGETKSRIAL